MTALAIALTIICSAVFLTWTSRHFLIARSRKTSITLSPASAGPPAEAPLISVLVAAKDEQENIGTCVRTMLQQDYPNFEVLVINDRSKDRTAEIVREIAAEDSRLRLVDITDLPEGWCGKNHAMWQGIRQARGPWLCMIDADCRQTSNRTLSVAMQYAQDQQADLLSVLPTLEMKGFWENVVQPVCGGIMLIWFLPERVNSPHRPEAYANGAFMLMKRSAYEAIGTHEAVKDRVNEDMHMADRIKKAKLRLQVVQNEGLYLVRMYTSLAQILNGWSRIFYGTFGTMRRLRVSLMVLLVMGLTPYFTGLLGWSLWDAGIGGQAMRVAGIVGTAAVAMQIWVIFRFYRLIGAQRWLAWSYSIGCAVGIVALLKAMGKYRSGGKVVWRGTAYATSSGKPSAAKPPQKMAGKA